MTTPSATPTPGSVPAAETSDQSWWGRYRVWPTWAHVTTGIVSALVLALVGTTAVAVHLYREPLPTTTGEVTLPGLGDAVEVFRDGHGIPHIYGDTDRDLVRAQGYVHAQERFFEMDVRRHATAGRLSELFGSEGLASDKMVRTMGWRNVAEQELGVISTNTRTLLDAYAEGVNAYISQHSPGEMAVEYTFLGLTGLDYTPSRWSAVDSLAWLKAMAWDLRGNMDDEIDRAVAALDNPAEVVEALHPAYDHERHAPIVEPDLSDLEASASPESETEPETAPDAPLPEGALDASAASEALHAVRSSLDAMPALLGKGDGIGSNSWVVSGERTASGMPLLANDPHLSATQPGIWMQMGLHCREATPDCTLDVSGFTFSGLPGVVIGHNATIAWGFTNLSPDVTDLYLERVRGERWLHGKEMKDLVRRRETIKVHDGEDFELTVRATEHGPLISDVDQEASSIGANAAARDAVPGREARAPYAVALAWTALEPGTTADAIFALNRASDWESFRGAAALFDVPSQNLVYADREGNIGYQAPGKVPVRRKGNDGRAPAAGWVKANDWTGRYVPFDELPSVLNPDEGMIVTANQAVTGPDYEHHLTDDWDAGYRSQRIRDLLEGRNDLTPADMVAIQLDADNPMARALVPHLLEVAEREDLGSYVGEAVELLTDWDFQDDADSAAAAYFNVVAERVLALTFHDDLRARIHPRGGSRWVQVIEGLLTRPSHVLWDDRGTEDEVEDRDTILRQALVEARDELTQLRSVRPREWTWGHLHQLELTHQSLGTSGIGFVEGLFNRNGGGIGGGPSAPNATAWHAAEGFRVTSAPSMRMVVDLADFDDSVWISLTGVSGHPASPHYDDQTELFVEGRTLPWTWTRDRVRDGADRLVLTPDG